MGDEHRRIVRLRTVTSTQDAARGLPVGSIVIADLQTAGRGRYDRTWEAREGASLLVSFVLEPRALLSIAAGVAAAEACGTRVRLKWPNDLLLDGRKLAGILVEVTGATAICGIGINLTWAPPGAAVLNVPREELFERLCEQVATWTHAPADAVLERWRRLSDTLGRRVRIELPHESAEGVAEDIGPHGELIVDGAPYVAGTLTHLS